MNEKYWTAGLRLRQKSKAGIIAKKQIYENQRDIIHLREQADQQQKDIEDLQDRNKWLGSTTDGAAISLYN